MSRSLVAKGRHNIKMMSVFVKMADVNAENFKVNEFIQALAPKSMQEKESNMCLRKA